MVIYTFCVFQRRNSFNQGKRRLSGRAFRAERENSIRRTVYVSDIDQQVSELEDTDTYIWVFCPF